MVDTPNEDGHRKEMIFFFCSSFSCGNNILIAGTEMVSSFSLNDLNASGCRGFSSDQNAVYFIDSIYLRGISTQALTPE